MEKILTNCKNCNRVYVGRTSRELHERFTEQRQPCLVSDHFNNLCLDMDYLKFTPLELVPVDTEQDPRDLDSSNILSRLRYWSETRPEWGFNNQM